MKPRANATNKIVKKMHGLARNTGSVKSSMSTSSTVTKICSTKLFPSKSCCNQTTLNTAFILFIN